MKRIVTILAMALMMAFSGIASGCAGGSLDSPSGYVVGKRHVEAKTTMVYDAALHRYRPHHRPEAWILYVADSTAVHKCHVDQSTFDKAQKGQYITLELDW